MRNCQRFGKQVTISGMPEATRIYADSPKSWRDLQDKVAQILGEAGVEVCVEKEIGTARGKVEIDVWANDPKATPSQIYLIECKNWRKRVPKSEIHAFRSVVGDSGANWGAIISARGFQKGAFESAKYSNVRLLSWNEFQDLFVEPWLNNHFCVQIKKHSAPLIEYTETMNARILRKEGHLAQDRRSELRRLREVHVHLAHFCSYITSDFADLNKSSLPLRNARTKDATFSLPASILDARSYRELMDSIVREVAAPIDQFDAVFGEQA